MVCPASVGARASDERRRRIADERTRKTKGRQRKAAGVELEDHAYLERVLDELFPPRRKLRNRGKESVRRIDAGEGQVLADTDIERRVTAVATLVLAQVAARGGTPLSVDPLLTVAERALSTFPTKERGAVLEEVVAVLDWLATAFDRAGTTGSRERDRGDTHDVHHDPDPWIDRISDALDDVHDLDIEYYSFHRGEWSSRRVTPKKVDGEWLVAHCHMRDDERRFRLTRIRTMAPA